ncbi:MAG: hypothetical protein F4Y02_10585 [Chloroflexi bacterium]|nr:hypothetical protein [Chloroflexota bacterium]
MTRDDALAALVAWATDARDRPDEQANGLDRLVRPLEIRSAWHRAGKPPMRAGEYRLALVGVVPETWWTAPLDAVPMQPGQFRVSASPFEGGLWQGGSRGVAPTEVFVDGDVVDAFRLAGAALLAEANVDYVDLVSTGGGWR